MSCGGNRFECALRKKSRLSTQSDRPSNLELYNENQKRLNELLRAREEIDNHFFKPIANPHEIVTRSVDCLLQESITVNDIETTNPTTTIFTPWVVPKTTS
jgi:hypothetical protein